MTVKIKSGISGLDKILKGGLNKGDVILLSGGPGTCKTIAALQYIYKGALENNEPGVYISFEESVDDLKKDAECFGWNFDKLEKSKKVLNFTK